MKVINISTSIKVDSVSTSDHHMRQGLSRDADTLRTAVSLVSLTRSATAVSMSATRRIGHVGLRESKG